MRARRFGLATLVALVIASASTASVSASCASQTIADQILRADVIASGVVTAADFGGNRVTFRPVVIYKGELESGATRVRTGPVTGSGGLTVVRTSVDYQADPGIVHTLYLRRESDGFATDSCSGSHSGQASGAETAALGMGRAVDSGGGPLIQLWDQLGAVPVPGYLALLLIIVLILLVLRSRRRPPLTPAAGAVA